MTSYLNAYTTEMGAGFLYALMHDALAEPHTTISHTKMPTFEEHLKWLAARTHRVLLLIHTDTEGLLGYVSVTNNNEIGIRLAKWARGKGHGKRAIQHILSTCQPLPGIPSVRPGRFVANINPANEASIRLFTGLGAKHIQNTYAF